MKCHICVCQQSHLSYGSISAACWPAMSPGYVLQQLYRKTSIKAKNLPNLFCIQTMVESICPCILNWMIFSTVLPSSVVFIWYCCSDWISNVFLLVSCLESFGFFKCSDLFSDFFNILLPRIFFGLLKLFMMVLVCLTFLILLDVDFSVRPFKPFRCFNGIKSNRLKNSFWSSRWIFGS